MRNKIVLFVLTGCLFTGPVYADNVPALIQTTNGNKSPVIKAGGDATVIYGLSKEEYQKMLQEELKKFAGQMQAATGDAKERRLREQQLQAVQAKLANIQKSYDEELQRRQAADDALKKLKDQLPASQLKRAEESLKTGDTKAAEEAFDAVVAKGAGSIALAAYQSGQLAEGRVGYPKAMRQYTKAVVLEGDNVDYLLAAGTMARTMGEYRQAEVWLGRLLELREAGKDELALARVQHDLAWLYHNQARYAEAEPLYRRSLAIKEKSLGKDHPDVAATLNNLAELYRTQGRYAEAEPLYRRSLAIRESKLGKDHPAVATALNNLAELYKAQGRYAEAEPLYTRSLSIFKAKLPADHPTITTVQKNYNALKQKMAEQQ